MQHIGRVLREAREQQGLSLGACEEGTRIRRRYLEALEDGRMSELPGEVYIKGFLRSYGNYLGLDGAALVEQYKGKQTEEESPDREAAPARSELNVPTTVRVQRKGNGRPRTAVLLVRRLVVGLLLLAAVGALVYGGWRIGQQLGRRAEPVQDPPPAQGETPGAADPGGDAGKEEPPAPPKPPEPVKPKVQMAAPVGDTIQWLVPEAPIAVKLDFSDRVWISVAADGAAATEEIVTAGTVREYSADKELRVRVGWSAGVTITVNEEPFGKVPQDNTWDFIFTAQ